MEGASLSEWTQNYAYSPTPEGVDSELRSPPDVSLREIRLAGLGAKQASNQLKEVFQVNPEDRLFLGMCRENSPNVFLQVQGWTT